MIRTTAQCVAAFAAGAALFALLNYTGAAKFAQVEPVAPEVTHEPYPWPSLEETLEAGDVAVTTIETPQDQERLADLGAAWTFHDNWPALLDETGTDVSVDEWAAFADTWSEGYDPDVFEAAMRDLLENSPAVRQLWTRSQRMVALVRQSSGNNGDHPTAHRTGTFGEPCLCESHGGIPINQHAVQGSAYRVWWTTHFELESLITGALPPLQETE